MPIPHLPVGPGINNITAAKVSQDVSEFVYETLNEMAVACTFKDPSAPILSANTLQNGSIYWGIAWLTSYGFQERFPLYWVRNGSRRYFFSSTTWKVFGAKILFHSVSRHGWAWAVDHTMPEMRLAFPNEERVPGPFQTLRIQVGLEESSVRLYLISTLANATTAAQFWTFLEHDCRTAGALIRDGYNFVKRIFDSDLLGRKMDLIVRRFAPSTQPEELVRAAITKANRFLGPIGRRITSVGNKTFGALSNGEATKFLGLVRQLWQQSGQRAPTPLQILQSARPEIIQTAARSLATTTYPIAQFAQPVAQFAPPVAQFAPPLARLAPPTTARVSLPVVLNDTVAEVELAMMRNIARSSPEYAAANARIISQLESTVANQGNVAAARLAQEAASRRYFEMVTLESQIAAATPPPQTVAAASRVTLKSVKRLLGSVASEVGSLGRFVVPAERAVTVGYIASPLFQYRPVRGGLLLQVNVADWSSVQESFRRAVNHLQPFNSTNESLAIPSPPSVSNDVDPRLRAARLQNELAAMRNAGASPGITAEVERRYYAAIDEIRIRQQFERSLGALSTIASNVAPLSGGAILSLAGPIANAAGVASFLGQVRPTPPKAADFWAGGPIGSEYQAGGELGFDTNAIGLFEKVKKTRAPRASNGRWVRESPPLVEVDPLLQAHVESLWEIVLIRAMRSSTEQKLPVGGPGKGGPPFAGPYQPSAGRNFWLFRGRDRNLILQTLRDLEAILERDQLAESGKKTTKISTSEPIIDPNVGGIVGAVEVLVNALRWDASLVRDRSDPSKYHSIAKPI